MSYAESVFLPREEQKLALTRNLGDALAAVAEKLWPHHTAKRAETEWGLDRTTAKNVTRGVVGGVVVTKALHAQQAKQKNAWALWLALGELVIGEPLEAYELREIARINQEADDARDRQAERLARRQALAQRTDALVSSWDRPGAALDRRAIGRVRAAPDGVGDRSSGSQTLEVGETTSFAPTRRRT
jgi:hypothetical protein